jgi:hypothetical protein
MRSREVAARTKSSCFGRVCLAAGLSLCAGSAGAQNLVVDGDFAAGNLAAWAFQQGSRSWDSFTESGTSGSVLLASDVAFVGQCFTVAEGTDLFAHASSFLPVQGGDYSTRMTVSFYDNPGCVFNIQQNDVLNSVEDSWVVLKKSITAPTGAESVAFQVFLFSNEVSARVAYFDNIVLVPGLFVDGFETGSTGVWSDAIDEAFE